jgi:hypothetical protein
VTIVGLLVSIWLAFRVRTLGKPSLTPRANQVLRGMFFAVVLFFVGILVEALFGSRI